MCQKLFSYKHITELWRWRPKLGKALEKGRFKTQKCKVYLVLKVSKIVSQNVKLTCRNSLRVFSFSSAVWLAALMMILIGCADALVLTPTMPYLVHVTRYDDL